ncbi:MAG: hypothetical protein AAF497_24495, partial [Planctomycetota bacterium]
DWYTNAIVASYPGGASDLPVFPQANVANTLEDADAIAGRGSEFKYNPDFHPLRFNQYSRSSDWEKQKPTMPSFDKDSNTPSQSLAEAPDAGENSDSEISGNEPDGEQLALDNPTPDNPSPEDLTAVDLTSNNEAVDNPALDSLAMDSTTENGTAEAAVPDNGALDIALDDPQSDVDEGLTSENDDVSNSEAVASLNNGYEDVPSNDDEIVLDDSTPDVSEYPASTNETDDDLTDVQAEVDASNAEEAFDTVVSSETVTEPVQKVSPIEINARVAGHNLALAGLQKRTERAFSGNYKDIVNVVERMEQLFDAHIKARLMIDSVPELQSQLIQLDNILHLTSEVNRQLQQFLHSKTEDMDRNTLESLQQRADAIYRSAEGL